MQASTAKACLRRLSDWVNPVSKHHAWLRSLIAYRQSVGILKVSYLAKEKKIIVERKIRLTSTGMLPQITQSIGTTALGSWVLPALATPTQ